MLPRASTLIVSKGLRGLRGQVVQTEEDCRAVRGMPKPHRFRPAAIHFQNDACGADKSHLTSEWRPDPAWNEPVDSLRPCRWPFFAGLRNHLR
jgi:hypothetical protein